MSPEDFRRLALALPGSIEASHMRHPDLRVGKRVFATIGDPCRTQPILNHRRASLWRRGGSSAWVEVIMTSANRFTNAGIEPAGVTSGDDDGSHNLFKIVGTDGAPTYGEYIYSFLENEYDFNIEIDQFGFSESCYLGSADPEKRQRFPAEEAATAEQLIRSFFLSKPKIYTDRFSKARFTGGVTFRPGWILEKS
jgi:hypothetical protein